MLSGITVLTSTLSQGSHMSGEMELTTLSLSNETALMLGMLESFEMMKREN